MNDDDNLTMEDLNFLLKKKWTLCVLTDMHLGSRHFQDFNKNLPEISTKVLTQTLNELENAGLIEKSYTKDKPKSTEYSLTPKGKSSKNMIKEYYGFIASVSANSDDEKEIFERIAKL